MKVTTGDLLVGGCALVLGVADVHLIGHGKPPVTETLRRPVVLAGLTVLTAHAWDVLGPFDPFRAVARLIPRSK